MDGAVISVRRYGEGRPVLAVHGITGNGASWAPVAAALPDVAVHAVDLRGRARSAGLPGPWGMARHADDVAEAITDLDVGPVMIMGHSMGAFVAAYTAARHPELITAVLLVDGGLPLHPPAGVGVPDAVAATLGPALERLSMSFADRAAYHAFWRRHPALGPWWSPEVEAYVDADLVGEPPALRSSVSAEAVAQDSAELFDRASVNAALASIGVPMILLTAPRGLLDAAPLYDADTVAGVRRALPELIVREVPEVNHYTILLGSGAPVVAAAARELIG